MDRHDFKASYLVCGLLLICTSTRLLSTAVPVNSAPRIGIVGGGIGGAMTAYFIRNLFGEDAKIDVYEKNRVGGRLALIKIGDHNFEAGGSIIHKRNRYVSAIAKILKFKRVDNHDGRMGLYDGKEFVFEESAFSYLTYIDLMWRYGLSIMRWNNLIEEILNQFDNVYNLQNDGYSYTTVAQFLNAINPRFVNMTQTTTLQLLKDNDFNEKFIDELAAGAVRVNYGQTTEANGFVGALSLSASQSSLWSVGGGNYQLVEGALTLSKATLIQAKVDTITLLSGGTFRLSSTLDNQGVKEVDYDIVIIAAPQTQDQRSIGFNGFPEEMDKYFPGHYHQTVATFVKAEVNNKYFGYNYPSAIPDDIISINENLSFNSLSRNFPVDKLNTENDNDIKPPKVFKVFSQNPLTEAELDKLFKKRTVTKSIDWLAYPHYTTPEKLGDFKLYNFMYYTSAIEWAGSAMEMSAVSAKNAALLAYNEYNDIKKNDEIYKPKIRKTEL